MQCPYAYTVISFFKSDNSGFNGQGMHPLAKIKHLAGQIKVETYALFLAARDSRTPWYVKIVIAVIVGYALSPVDLIPDFIPVIGYLDDLFILPLGIALAVKLIPQPVLADCRARAMQTVNSNKLPVSWVAGIVIILLWIFITVILGVWVYESLIA